MRWRGIFFFQFSDDGVVMKERPILFSGPMVRAILEGRKTQTRRVIQSPRPNHPEVVFLDHGHGWWPYCSDDGESTWCDDDEYVIHCPYGGIGDQLWVRETHYVFSAGYKDGTGLNIVYRATEPDAPCSWTPSIHMPRWASRLLLDVVSVRAERLSYGWKEDPWVWVVEFQPAERGRDA